MRSTHRLVSGRSPVCEIYPDVLAGRRGLVVSRWAGMAMQQPGDIVERLPDGPREWLTVRGLESAAGWVVTVAGMRDEFWQKQHGAGRSVFGSPVGPMGPSCRPRRLLSPRDDGAR